MSLSQRNLSSIQKAGQAVHSASEAIAATVADQAQSIVARLASHPFGAESEQAVARFKMLSSLSQGLIAMEAKLQELYAIAGDLASPASDVIVLPAVATKKSLENSAAVDVVAKPAKAAKKVKRSDTKPAALTSNDAKLLAFLQKKLKVDVTTKLSGTQISSGSKLPMGSVGVSLKRIVDTGAVKVVGRGTYQLGTAAALASPAPEPKLAAVKKVKPASKKAKPAKVEAPAAKPVKVKAAAKTVNKAAKKAKSALSKQPAAAVEAPLPAAPIEDQPALV